MRNFIIRRVALGIFITFFALMVVYAIIRSLPSSYVETSQERRNPLSTNLSGMADSTQWSFKPRCGLSRVILAGWGNAIKGDFGESWHYGIPVTEKFNQVIWYSVIINIITFFVQMFIAIPLGITAARNQYSKTDYAISIFALAGISLPTFFLATILKYVFSIQLGWFDLYGLTGRYFSPRPLSFGIWLATWYCLL